MRDYTVAVAKKSGKSAPARVAEVKAPGDLFTRVQVCIDEKIRPFIQMDGGDIELIELTVDKKLRVRLHGACVGCMASTITLQYGVQNAINEEFPEEDIQLELAPND